MALSAGAVSAIPTCRSIRARIAASAEAGSLREEIRRGGMVIADQFIDVSKQRKAGCYEAFAPRAPVHRATAAAMIRRL